MTWDPKKYPKDWSRIRKRVLERANNRCECAGECGLHQGRRCIETNGSDARFANGKILLTIAHLCHDPQCRKWGHLKAMCQRCHLRYDRDLHAKNAARTRRIKQNRGQLSFEDL